ncbi:hypothetical protein [Albibacterium indicum]|uniref:hypothetical protein n=1 Tax=Albibacterium indicum TaxID=2292082 RepID=UPI001300A646|nr:hypothetical protein [Pedobacter indicus]
MTGVPSMVSRAGLYNTTSTSDNLGMVHREGRQNDSGIEVLLSGREFEETINNIRSKTMSMNITAGSCEPVCPREAWVLPNSRRMRPSAAHRSVDGALVSYYWSCAKDKQSLGCMLKK